MAIDLRRCAEAAAHAALAEAFAPPKPKPRRRRLRPVRAVLVSIGLVTVVWVARSPELRSSILQAVAERFPIEELLDEIVLDADVIPDAEEGEPEADEAGGADGEQPAQEQSAGQQRRRPVTRARGDRNGQHGRKPPNRGTRA